MQCARGRETSFTQKTIAMTVLSKRFDPFFSLGNPLFGEALIPSVIRQATGKAPFIPAANILEEKEKFYVQLAVPGFRKEDFKVALKERVLTISAEKQVEAESQESQPTYTLREFGFTSFKRSFHLPETIDLESISASYEEGILKLDIPKKPAAVLEAHRLIGVN